MISNVKGSFAGLSGILSEHASDASLSAVEATVDVATVSTGDAQRDGHLKSADFFDVENFPTMIFKSTKVEPKGGGDYTVTGDLTLHGVTKEVVLDVEGPTAAIKDPWGNQRAAATATAKINRQDFGVKWNKTLDNGGMMLGDDVAITIDIEMFQPAAKAAN
jgi:polyisoprenoid-binding protein YceI